VQATAILESAVDFLEAEWENLEAGLGGSFPSFRQQIAQLGGVLAAEGHGEPLQAVAQKLLDTLDRFDWSRQLYGEWQEEPIYSGYADLGHRHGGPVQAVEDGAAARFARRLTRLAGGAPPAPVG